MARHSWKSSSSLLLIVLSLLFFLVQGQEAAQAVYASIPPRGWNSYDSFSWIITEEQFLDNARVVSHKLLQHGYQYVVVDYLWYRKFEPGAYTNSLGFDVIDEWGRPIPDPKRWPSSKGGEGFKSVAENVHKMGLKFGIHVMRGISTQAFSANTPIRGSNGLPYQEGGRIWRARDIGLKNEACKWMSAGFMSVDTRLGASQAFLRSLYQQYAEWGVDFVKHDCVFGDDLNINEITTVSQILKGIERPILYSISPGTKATVDMAKEVSALVNMYRVTGDDWDTWKDVQSHFNVSREFAIHGLIGSQGLLGKSWPDLDMLPFGSLSSVGANEGPYRTSNLTFNEQKTQMTLWAMAKSPLMFGGDLRNIDNNAMELITNPTVLDINAYSTKNMEVQVLEGNDARAWIAKGSKKGQIYISFFNLSLMASRISTKVKDVMKVLRKNNTKAENEEMNPHSLFKKKCAYYDAWSGQGLGLIRDKITIEIPGHGSALFVIQCA